MDLEYVKLRTIANLPIIYKGISIQPKTIRDIIEFGYGDYNKNLSMIVLTKQKIFSEDVDQQIPEDVTLAEALIGTKNYEFLEMYLDAFKYFFGSSATYYTSEELFFDDKVIRFSELNDTVKIIKVQNCLVTADEETFNPLNERAKKIKEKMLANKKKIQELNSSSDDDSLSFIDLISILCSNANGLSMLNIFDLNMFQFSDQFNRMKMIDDYEVNIQALLHGADSKSIELKHWISKRK